MSRSRFSGRVVFVTGGTSGLGAEACELFIKEGAKVFVTDLEERSILQRLGPNAHYQKCDVGVPEDCEAAVKSCVDRYGRLDALFHNAGRFTPLSTVVNQDVNIYREIINVDLNSLFYLARVVIPQMQKQKGGSIVVTASTSGLGGDFGNSSYGAAKAGIINFARCLALDHGAEGIRVNCVCPGYMITPMTAGFRAAPDAEKLLLGSIPMSRGCTPLEVAHAVLFLASDEASFISGQGESDYPGSADRPCFDFWDHSACSGRCYGRQVWSRKPFPMAL